MAAPGSTSVASSSGRTRVSRLRTMACDDPPGRSVRPIEPAKRTSPEKSSESTSGSGG